MTPLRIITIMLSTISLLSLFPALSFSQTTCKSLTFSNKKNFDHCIDLPALSAILHWTYSPTNRPNPTLSMAFTAPPPNPDGWVAWALNPNGSGMVGAQSILAYKPNPNGPISVSTYDIKSYHDITIGPISYNVTGLSAEESNGKITVFATWDLRHGESDVNHVWQVGPVVGGKPGKHEFKQDNLGSKMKLHLVNGLGSGLAGAPVGSPGVSKTGNVDLGSNAARDDAKLTKFWFVLGAILVYIML